MVLPREQANTYTLARKDVRLQCIKRLALTSRRSILLELGERQYQLDANGRFGLWGWREKSGCALTATLLRTSDWGIPSFTLLQF